MKHRSPAAVFFLSIITFTIYSLVWSVKTKGEMNRLGANIPTAWLLIVPFVNIYWLWQYSQGVEKVTGGQTSGVLAFILLFLLGFIGMAVLQVEFNKVGTAAPAMASVNPAGGAPVNPAPSTLPPTAPPTDPTGGGGVPPTPPSPPAATPPVV